MKTDCFSDNIRNHQTFYVPSPNESSTQPILGPVDSTEENLESKSVGEEHGRHIPQLKTMRITLESSVFLGHLICHLPSIILEN